jgi:hypothetical protein
MDTYSVFHQVVAIGWGQKAEDIKILSKELQQVTLQTIAYESDSCKRLIFDKSRQFCAGDETDGKGKNGAATKENKISSI